MAEIGIESRRESSPIPGQFPKLKTLHVWWARRPLVASAAAVVGSLMPAWSPELAQRFEDRPELATAKDYREWFLRLCGVWGDPVAARRASDAAKARGERLPGNPFTYKQAYKNSPTPEHLALLHRLLESTWGRMPTVSDPTAGGGSIPYEALRYRLPTHANDLNPVATAVLEAGLEFPARYGPDLAADLRRWGDELVNRLQARLAPFFEAHHNQKERAANFIFARTVACPRTDKTVPLLPNRWLRRGDKPVAVRVITHSGAVERAEPGFELVEGDEIDFDPDRGTITRGKAVSVWDHLIIDGDYIKAEARAGRMGEVLYAVAIRTPKGRGFRAPTATDFEALAAAERERARLAPQWQRDDLLPDEPIPDGNKTREPHNYGMYRWRQMFTPRQLLVHGCFVQQWRKLTTDIRAEIAERDRAEAVAALLAFMGDKALAFNSKQCGWHVSRQTIAPAFSMHAFPLKWTFAEFEAGTELFAWTLSQLLDAYTQIAELLVGVDASSTLEQARVTPAQVQITTSNAANMTAAPDGSATLVCIDPPYYDNVMYAELSDYFYVWLKRTLGWLRPDRFNAELTDKANEAVANRARFAAASARQARSLADHDYTIKMAAIFAECRRVLVDEGVLTVMFTHKGADAWNALGTSLLQAGFVIGTSWPVHTESQQSLHQAGQNSVSSTILLVCRKRPSEARGSERTYLSDIVADIRQTTADALTRAHDNGLSGVDLLLSTYGPALAVLSGRWPVYATEATEDGTSRLLRPEEALDIARAEVTRRLKARLVGRPVDFDPLTDFVIAAWELFKARVFPFDEARRLGLAVGGQDIDDLKLARILEAKSGKVELCSPRQRLRRDGDEHAFGVNRTRREFTATLDAVHTALYVADLDGLAAAKAWLDERGLSRDQRFIDCMQALLRAIPRSRKNDQWNVAEAETLDRLASAYFEDLDRPTAREEYTPATLDLDGK